MTRFPTVDDGASVAFKDGRFDEGAARAYLAESTNSGFIMWGNDSRAVVAFAYEFLSQLTSVTRHIESDPETTAHISAQSAADRRLESRMERGRFAYTRFDITGKAGGVRVRVSCANPKEIPGTALASARRFGVYACRILLYLKRELERGRKDVHIMLEGVGDMADIFNEAAWNDRRQEEKDAVTLANAERCKCQYRLGDYCSPSQPHCRCYRDGRCVEATLPEHLKTYNKES